MKQRGSYAAFVGVFVVIVAAALAFSAQSTLETQPATNYTRHVDDLQRTAHHTILLLDRATADAIADDLYDDSTGTPNSCDADVTDSDVQGYFNAVLAEVNTTGVNCTIVPALISADAAGQVTGTLTCTRTLGQPGPAAFSASYGVAFVFNKSFSNTPEDSDGDLIDDQCRIIVTDDQASAYQEVEIVKS